MENTTKPMSKVIRIDESDIHSHPDEMVSSTFRLKARYPVWYSESFCWMSRFPAGVKTGVETFYKQEFRPSWLCYCQGSDSYEACG